MIKIPPGEHAGRQGKAVVNDVVKDTDSFYLYLTFLLGGDNYLLSALENAFEQRGGRFGCGSWGGAGYPALYERMLRTAASAPERFQELDYILQMVDQDIIPQGFMELYTSFRKAVGL